MLSLVGKSFQDEDSHIASIYTANPSLALTQHWQRREVRTTQSSAEHEDASSSSFSFSGHIQEADGVCLLCSSQIT
jgi:hypothetical protein